MVKIFQRLFHDLFHLFLKGRSRRRKKENTKFHIDYERIICEYLFCRRVGEDTRLDKVDEKFSD